MTTLEWRVYSDPGVQHSSLEDAQHEVQVLYLNTHLCLRNPKHGDEYVHEGLALITDKYLMIGFPGEAALPAAAWGVGSVLLDGGSRSPVLEGMGARITSTLA